MSTRAVLRTRRLRYTIPKRSDQIASRARRGPRGGRLPASDPQRYKEQRNVVERAFARLKQFRALARGWFRVARPPASART